LEIEIYTLSSGSKSNSTYIRLGDTRILIDAGMSMKATEIELQKLGTSLKQINGIFITHEHSDHVKGLAVITKKHIIPIHVNELSAPYIECNQNSVIIHKPVFTHTIGNVEIESFITPHDSHGSVGYIVKTDNYTVGVATDMGYVTSDVLNKLAECNSVVLESNHDRTMLEYGTYPLSLKKRILSNKGHLSNKDCADCAALIAGNGVKHIMLAHLSDENNRPDIAMITTATELARKNLSRTVIKVANRNTITKLC
jgi:Metal-dependent hydrolases of the beta-lactamase superfamily I